MNYDQFLEKNFQQRCLETDAFERFLEEGMDWLVVKYSKARKEDFEEWAFEEFQRSQGSY